MYELFVGVARIAWIVEVADGLTNPNPSPRDSLLLYLAQGGCQERRRRHQHPINDRKGRRSRGAFTAAHISDNARG